MEELMLLQPDETMYDEINAYRKAMIDADSSMDGTGPLRQLEAEDWLCATRSLLSEETCPPQWVPATQYVCVRKTDSRIVGMIQVRHRFNGYLEVYGGHIGYSVRPDERCKGYAKWMLAHVLPEAKELGLSRVLVTCDEDNEASRRTILKNGGAFDGNVWLESENQNVSRYWITL